MRIMIEGTAKRILFTVPITSLPNCRSQVAYIKVALAGVMNHA